MTNYRQQLHTADEALAYAEAHLDAELIDHKGTKIKPSHILSYPPDMVVKYAPYTVIKTGNTITIDGVTYREGDALPLGSMVPEGLTITVTKGNYLWHDAVCRILHIPDDVADKPEPKEPRTLTWDEFKEVKQCYVIDPLYETFRYVNGCTFDEAIVLKFHYDNGGKLYPTEQDAELGKARGWK